MKLVLALTCTLALIAPSDAQTVQRQAQVWRCGPDGRDLRDAPCPTGGAASTVQFDDPSASDRQSARERAHAEAREAQSLASARRAREAQARQQRALILGSAPIAPPPGAAPAASTPASPHAKPPKLARPHKPPAPPKPRAVAASATATGR
ncbi:MAG: hypothetical protein EKK53_25500 [Burkholderiales bacterium]|nr:MAG: hypothetical protein EKK53_25500 [Burkholderiales bacterium]